MIESKSSHSDTDSMPEEEPILKLFHPATGEELDPDSIQYQALCRFLYTDNNNLGPTGILNQQDDDPHNGQYLPSEGLRGPSQTTSLKVYTRDSSKMHRWIPNTRGRETTQIKDSEQGPILCSLSNHNSCHMASIKKESIHYFPTN